MSGGNQASDWRFTRFALFVTGIGERRFLPTLFRPLTADGRSHFAVVHQIGQLSPISSPTRQLKMLGKGQTIPTRDEEIGLQARKHLTSGKFDFLMIVDDLEGDRVARTEDVFARYRNLLDIMLRPVGLEARASVHFLVNMLEAYYFADASAINRVLGTTLSDFDGDVETIAHPKNHLKAIVAGQGQGRAFDEIEHGERVLAALDLAQVLAHPERCRSLRTAYAWCRRAIGLPPGDLFRLSDGQLAPVTAPQLDRLPVVPGA